MLTPEQKKLRRTGLGSSDIATIAGLGPFRKNGQPFHDPMEIWCDKTGKAQDDEDDDEGAEQKGLGHRLEPVIGQWYAEDRGIELSVLKPGTARHPSRKFMLATPDFVVRDAKGLVTEAIEVKNVGTYMVKDWRDGVPVYVTAQNLWQQEVLGIQTGHVAALLGGRDRVSEPIAYVVEVVAALVEVGEQFWDEHVIKDIPPPINATDSWARYLKEKFPEVRGGMVEMAGGDEEAWALEWLTCKEQIDILEERQAEATNNLKAVIDTNKGIFAPGWQATWGSCKGNVLWKAVAEALWAGAAIPVNVDIANFAEPYRGDSYRKFTCKRKETP